MTVWRWQDAAHLLLLVYMLFIQNQATSGVYSLHYNMLLFSY
jgi:hypothetical protein